MGIKYLNDEQKEFIEDISQKSNDTITSIEMICFDAEKNLFKSLEISLPLGRSNLWAILAYGEKGMYIFVNPTEPTVLGLKIGRKTKPPKEQLFPFTNFLTWKVEPIVKKAFFITYTEKYSLLLHVSYKSPEQGEMKGTIVMQTQTRALDTLNKMNKYKK